MPIDKEVIFKIKDEEFVIDSALNSLARGAGWTDTVLEDGVVIPNPISQLEHIRKFIMGVCGGVIQTYEANQAAEQAKGAALQATAATIGNITSTLEVV